MNTIELGEFELRILELFIDKMEEVSLNTDEKVYRIRDVYTVLYDHFKEIEPSINRQAIYDCIDKLEKVGLLKIVGKTQIKKGGDEEYVHELQLERFDKSKIVKIEKRYQMKKESGDAEHQPKLGIKGGWFKLRPYVPANPMSQLEIDLLKRRDEIIQDMTRLENLLDNKRAELKEATNAISLAREARRFLEKNNLLHGSSQKAADAEVKQVPETGKKSVSEKELKLSPRENQVLRGIVEYLEEAGGNRIASLTNTLLKYFTSKDVKISLATVFYGVKGLEEVGLLRIVGSEEMKYKKQNKFIYEFNRELFDKSDIIVQAGIKRHLVPKSLQ
jgi:Fe2+ or Zn2+ uptake regulation protein